MPTDELEPGRSSLIFLRISGYNLAPFSMTGGKRFFSGSGLMSAFPLGRARGCFLVLCNSTKVPTLSKVLHPHAKI